MPPALCPWECDSTISCPCIRGSVSTNPAPRSLRGLNEDMCKAPARCPAHSGAFAQAVWPSRDASLSAVQQPRQADHRSLSWGLPVQGGRPADADGTGGRWAWGEARSWHWEGVVNRANSMSSGKWLLGGEAGGVS